MVAFILAPCYSRIHLWISESKLLIKISLENISSYTPPQWQVFAANFSAFCDRFLLVNCANRAIAEFFFVMISLVDNFFSRMFTKFW